MLRVTISHVDRLGLNGGQNNKCSIEMEQTDYKLSFELEAGELARQSLIANPMWMQTMFSMAGRVSGIMVIVFVECAMEGRVMCHVCHTII